MLNRICNQISKLDALDILQEECAELIKAASKIKRQLNGDPDVNPDSMENFIEELADVQLAKDVAIKKLLSVDEARRVTAGTFRKMERWEDRLARRQK